MESKDIDWEQEWNEYSLRRKERLGKCNIVDIKLLWPETYQKIKDKKWFKKLANFLYSISTADTAPKDTYKQMSLSHVAIKYMGDNNEQCKIS